MQLSRGNDGIISVNSQRQSNAADAYNISLVKYQRSPVIIFSRYQIKHLKPSVTS